MSDRAQERALWRAALSGDEDAWRVWYDATYGPLRAYVLWRCGGLADAADDVVQETWLTAVRRLRQFDPERSSFLSWLRGIAANLVRNRFRKDSRRRTESLPAALAAAAAPERDEAERLARALAELPEHYESVLRAKYLESASVAQIAGDRGESIKAVESLLTRARQALREALGLASQQEAFVPEGRP